MSIPQQSVRNWPLALYAICVVAVSLCYFAGDINLHFFVYRVGDSIPSGIFLGWCCILMLVAGLGGHVWFQGVLAAILAGIGGCLYSDIHDYFWYYPGDLGCFAGVGLRGPYVPFVVLSGGSPLLICRYWLGWRLTRNPHGFSVPRARYCVEELILLTAVIASAIFLLRIPNAVYELGQDDFFGIDRSFLGIVWYLFGYSLLLLPTVYFVFRSGSSYWRYVWILAICPISVFCYSYCTAGHMDPLESSFIVSLFVSMFVAILHMSGFRLVRYVKASRGLTAPVVSQEPDLWTATRLIQNRRLNRLLSIGFISVSITICLASGALSTWRQIVDAEQKQLTIEIAGRGGVLEFEWRKAYRLKIDKRAGDDFLKNYANFKEIVDLSFQETQISDAAIANLRKFSNLQRLNLNGTKVTDACLDDLCRLPELYELKIAGTSITRQGRMRLLKELSTLTSLDFSDLGIDDDELNELPYCKFGHLELRNNPISDAGLNRMLERISSRGLLDLSGTLVTGGSFTTCKFHQLVFGGAQITDHSISQLLSKPTEVFSLMIRDTSNTDAVLPELLGTTSAWILEIGDCAITEAGFAQVASQLDFSGRNMGLTGKQFTGDCFQQWHPHVHSLNMQGSGVNDESLQSIANLELLSGLSLKGTNVSDTGIQHLKKFKPFHWLDVSNTRVTADGLIAAQLACDYLGVASGQFTALELNALSTRYKIRIDAPYPYY